MVSFWNPQQLVGTELYHSMHENRFVNMELEMVKVILILHVNMWTSVFGEI